MHAGGAREAHQVKRAAGLDDVPERGLKHGVVLHAFVGETEVDAHDFLRNDAPGADVLVPDFGVAHDAFGQPDRGTVRGDFRARPFGGKFVRERDVRDFQRVVFVLFLVVVGSPTVSDDE